jgi:hypothetical protein
MKNHLSTLFYVGGDREKFLDGIQTAISQIAFKGIFTGDQLFTFGRNLSFLRDRDFTTAFQAQSRDEVEKSVIWRVYVTCWAAKRALSIEGDFVECGCYAGTTARIIADYTDIGDTDKRFYLYDLFEIPPEMRKNHESPKHGQDLHAKVRDRFSDLPNVRVLKGRLPEILDDESPERISFLHLDVSDPKADAAALARLFDRVSPGGAIILNYYGWLGFPHHKEEADRFLADRGCMALEIPTGQGLIIK